MKGFFCWFHGQSGRYRLQGKELHCGDCFQIRIGDVWHDVRIEMSGDRWYLHGVPAGRSTEPDAYEARLYQPEVA
jgi:hypothetical protein